MSATEPLGADCHVRLGADLIRHTWDAVVLTVLRSGPARRGDLIARIGGVSDKVVHQSLERLRAHGLVVRSSPRGRYELTAVGSSFAGGPLLALARWAEEHRDDLHAAGGPA
ncbi:winged helix-turn-helix transcriptional regulator [Actinokineospora bangkokensis]|uniref:HTH hxlR-type domain-containing protein n=1 Tax=Actinokineospora bangkokensis TaxID=1193682 RepID=A0A1Q9LL80_9PSEU|nr:helix-turn-helix domain-containing protein [Actinokineospora bangkokensis]OLR92797.1 hypothetical protein BJP25_19400 [Actinokineospora bangkokensis]